MGPLNGDGNVIPSPPPPPPEESCLFNKPKQCQIEGVGLSPSIKRCFQKRAGWDFSKTPGMTLMMWWRVNEACALRDQTALPSLLSTRSRLAGLWDGPTVTSVTTAQISPDHLLLHGSGLFISKVAIGHILACKQLKCSF